MLSIEGQVVVPPHPNFVAGLAALFSSYYNFNLVYQEQSACTLEFIQRCFVGINPTSGTKTAKLVSERSGKVIVSSLLSVSVPELNWVWFICSYTSEVHQAVNAHRFSGQELALQNATATANSWDSTARCSRRSLKEIKS
ncbi:uncharacterized protein LOC143321284 isoform X1 [Chaetodon auriga]|uniref:uncharacterized protein LOC143321284 isoform X1 n=1 Tax=Chaetodon auriga TaxID=39042 RepID=UPI004032EA49